MIGKNEEKNIEKCLSALMPYGFEIIYVDTGSTDRTKELAAKHGADIYDFEWIDDSPPPEISPWKKPRTITC